MQKDIGTVMGLYPMPVTVVGVVSGGRVNFLTISNVGVVDHGTLFISVAKNHEFSNAGIKENGVLSVNLVSEGMLQVADYCGIIKGAETDKSGLFKYHFGELEKAPIIDEAPVSMACRVVNSMEAGNFINYILKPEHTYVQEECLNEKGKIDYEKTGSVLFEFQSAQYLSAGKVIGKRWKIGKDYAQSIRGRSGNEEDISVRS
ncbi:MAG: flavin reductase family protein [Lachnospiraceae bacterium]|nr:flavin reductase family protein [Lachnospiraceae bacterium]